MMASERAWWRRLLDATKKACPKCKFYRGEEVSRKEISRYEHVENERVSVKNNKGETIGSTISAVKKRTVTFQVHYRCYLDDCNHHEWDDSVEETTTC